MHSFYLEFTSVQLFLYVSVKYYKHQQNRYLHKLRKGIVNARLFRGNVGEFHS